MNCLFVGGPWCGEVKSIVMPCPDSIFGVYPPRVRDLVEQPGWNFETVKKFQYDREIYDFGDKPFFAKRIVYVFEKIDKEWCKVKWLHNSAVIELIEKHWPAVGHKLRWHYL